MPVSHAALRGLALRVSIVAMCALAPAAAIGADKLYLNAIPPPDGILFYPMVSGNGATVTWGRATAQHAIIRSGGLTTDLGAHTYITGLSFDGSVAAGTDGSTLTPYRWANGTWSSLGLMPGFTLGRSNAISSDGTTIVGTNESYSPLLTHAFRHTAAGGLEDLDPTGPDYMDAWAVNRDGSVIVGRRGTDYLHPTPFVWQNGTTTDIDLLSGYTTGTAQFISMDGSVIVGHNQNSGVGIVGFRSMNGGTPIAIGLSGVGDKTTITSISDNGNVIVGFDAASSAPGSPHAFRWENGTYEQLPTLPHAVGEYAYDVSGDGLTTVGAIGRPAPEGSAAVRWTSQNGVQTVETIADLLAGSGVDTSGWLLIAANSVSQDGSVIAGWGFTTGLDEGVWIACFGKCGDPDPTAPPIWSFLDVNDATKSFASLGTVGATASTYLGSQFEAAGDMADAGNNGGITGFAYGAFDSDPTTSATVGATYALGDDLVIGGSLGIAGILTEMPFSGAASFTGPAVAAFIASRPESGPNWLVGGSLIGLTGTITRGYHNGAALVTSTGATNGSGAGFTAEAGWTFSDLVADTLVTPFVSVTVSSISYAGYTETGGPFPATFAAFTTTSAIARIGVDGRYEFGPDAYVAANLGYAHNFGNGGAISGAIPGLISLGAPGVSGAADFVEASVGLDMPVKDAIRFNGRIGVTVPFGGTPSSQARAGVTMIF
ncbi:MAG: autotransporter domain-containing protein [Devosia sp.]